MKKATGLKNPRRARRVNPTNQRHGAYVIFRTDGARVEFLASMPYAGHREPSWHGTHGIHWPTKGGAATVAKSLNLSASWRAGVAPASATGRTILQTLRGKV